MKNFVQPGDVLTLTAPYARSSGQAAKIGDIIAIATADIANAKDGEWKTTGVFTHAKAASQAWTQGQKVYWDDTAKVFTTTASGNTLAGVAVLAVAGGAGDTTGTVRLNGSF